MTEQHFSKFFAKLLVDSDENHDSPNLFSLHKTTPLKPENLPLSPESIPVTDQDQSPISAPPTVVPTQDQADEIPFEEAVPLEDELASLLDDIDD